MNEAEALARLAAAGAAGVMDVEVLPVCPPSAVRDMIVPWAQVREGDLIVWDGEFRLLTRKLDYAGEPLLWFDGSKSGAGVLPCGTYAAVRRYDLSAPDTRWDDLRAEIQRDRDTYDDLALAYGEMPGGDLQEQRANGAVEQCDRLLAWMAHADETDGESAVQAQAGETR